MNDFNNLANLLLSLETHSDPRGNLLVINFKSSLPFTPVRFFSTYNVPKTTSRGGHAHRTCEQLLIASSGSVEVTLYKNDYSSTFLLDSPETGLYIPPMTWGVQHDHSPRMVLSVFASEEYNSTEYIREFHEFEELSKVI
jgi:UDP-2-acetamido-3-amino-2,3-dideoxy-glucuronate N-acetyltransferase